MLRSNMPTGDPAAEVQRYARQAMRWAITLAACAVISVVAQIVKAVL
jgi:hypothetical protein